MTSRLIGKGSCPKCDKAYGYTSNAEICGVYEQENGRIDSTCFSCKSWYPYDVREGDNNVEVNKEIPKQGEHELAISNSSDDISSYRYGSAPGRGITGTIHELYNVRVSTSITGDAEAVYYPMYNINGDGISWKVRTLPKSFKILGGLNNIKLFGQAAFPAGGKRLVITEGEEDALAVAQAYHNYNGKIYPAISIPSSSNLKNVADNIEYINSFDEIVLYIDKDEAGDKARDSLAKIIGYDKNIRVAAGVEKDASDELVKNGHMNVLKAIWDATKFNPQGILTSSDLWKELESYNNIKSVPYPSAFVGLNRALKGMRGGEITLWTSGTGAGKSTMLREIAWHLLQNTEDKVGIISLEESPAETAKKMAAMALNRNPAAEDIPLGELKGGFDRVFGDDRVLVLDHAGAITESIVEQLKYMAVQGCKYLFVDHITILVSEGADGLTGNEAIDKVMNDLLKVAKTYNVWIGLVSHLRKMQTSGKSFEGGVMPSLDDIRGSGSIKQISNDIIAFSRNSEEGDNEIKMRVLKCRYTGLTGNAGAVAYDRDTGRLNPKDGDVNGEDF